MPTHPLFLWLHNKATHVEIIKFKRLYFQLGPGQLSTMLIPFNMVFIPKKLTKTLLFHYHQPKSSHYITLHFKFKLMLGPLLFNPILYAHTTVYYACCSDLPQEYLKKCTPKLQQCMLMSCFQFYNQELPEK